MPLITYHYTAPQVDGETREFVSDFVLPYRIPHNARFTLKQVSASTNLDLPYLFKYVVVYFPELMTSSNQVLFKHFKIGVNEELQEVNGDQGLRFFLTDPVQSPYALNVFPNLYLGRHHLHTTHLSLRFKAVGIDDQLAAVYSFSVVLEWDTE